MRASRMKSVLWHLLTALFIGFSEVYGAEKGQDWIDPFQADVETSSHYSKTSQDSSSKQSNETKKAAESSCAASPGSLAFRRFVKHVVDQADSIDGLINYQGSLSQANLRLLRRYTSQEEKVNVHDVRQVLEQLVIVSLQRSWEEVYVPLLYVGVHPRWHMTALFGVGALAVLLLVFLLYKALVMKAINMRRFMMRACIIFVVVSVPWEWYRLYSTALAKHEAELMKGMPKECQQGEMDIWTSVSAWARSTFTVSDDPCLKYHEAMLVNPFAEVSPSQAVGVAFTRMFTDPLQYVFSAIGKCLRALLKELPVTWHPFIGIILFFVTMLVVVTSTGYEVKVPFIFSLTPGKRPQTLAVEDSEQLTAIVQKGVKAGIEQAEQKKKSQAQPELLAAKPASSLLQAQPELLAAKPAAIEGQLSAEAATDGEAAKADVGIEQAEQKKESQTQPELLAAKPAAIEGQLSAEAATDGEAAKDDVGIFSAMQTKEDNDGNKQ